MISYLKLFALLQLKQMRVDELARAIGSSAATMAKMRKGKNINTDVICRICQALNVQPADIMEYIPEPEQGDQPEQQKE